MTKYDSTADTLAHIQVVRDGIGRAIKELVHRAEIHDRTKLGPNEKPTFDEVTPKLREMTYGSDEYKESLKSMGRALEHHYASHRHHPEHFTDGISGMNLIDLLEMAIDWHAASQRHSDGDVEKSVRLNAERFGYGDELSAALMNTVRWLQSVEPGSVRTNPFDRGRLDCAINSGENAPFFSVGGMEFRGNMKVPSYVMPHEEDDYLAGYRKAAQELYGDDWQTCEFGWVPALTIESEDK